MVVDHDSDENFSKSVLIDVKDSACSELDSENEGTNSSERSSKSPYRKVIGEYGFVKKFNSAWRKFLYKLFLFLETVTVKKTMKSLYFSESTSYD